MGFLGVIQEFFADLKRRGSNPCGKPGYFRRSLRIWSVLREKGKENTFLEQENCFLANPMFVGQRFSKYS